MGTEPRRGAGTYRDRSWPTLLVESDGGRPPDPRRRAHRFGRRRCVSARRGWAVDGL